MEPLSVLRMLWQHRLLALPVVALTIAGVVYVLLLGPRLYQSSATYVLVNPQVPTAEQLDRSARLARLNSNNPYLRSPDPSLIVQVMAAKLSAGATARKLQDAGLGPDYTVAQSAGNSQMLVVTGTGETAEKSIATTVWLTVELERELRTVQKVNGAADLYLFAALPVDVDATAVEKVSSRLRSVILVGVGGAVLLFSVVSLAAAWSPRSTRFLEPEVVEAQPQVRPPRALAPLHAAQQPPPRRAPVQEPPPRRVPARAQTSEGAAQNGWSWGSDVQ
jgi:hypothetical protein